MADDRLYPHNNDIAENPIQAELSDEFPETAEDLEVSLLAAIEELEPELAGEMEALAENATEPAEPEAGDAAEADPQMAMPLEPRISPPQGVGFMHADFVEDFHVKPRRKESVKPPRRKKPTRKTPAPGLIMRNEEKSFEREDKPREEKTGFSMETSLSFSGLQRKFGHGPRAPKEAPQSKKAQNGITLSDPKFGRLSLTPLTLQAKATEKIIWDTTDISAMALEVSPSQIKEPGQPKLAEGFLSTPKAPIVLPKKTGEKVKREERPKQREFMEDHPKQQEFSSKERPKQQQHKREEQPKQQEFKGGGRLKQQVFRREESSKYQERKREAHPKQQELERKKGPDNGMDITKISFSPQEKPKARLAPAKIRDTLRIKSGFPKMTVERGKFTEERLRQTMERGKFADEKPRQTVGRDKFAVENLRQATKKEKSVLALNMDFNNRGKSPSLMEMDGDKEKQHTAFKFSL